jgi:MFS family permease
MLGMGLGALGMWLISFSRSIEELLVGGVLLGSGYALSAPAWLALITELAPPGRLGLAVGASETVQGLGLVIGPLLGGLFWDTIGPRAPFVASAAVLTISAAIAYRVLRKT